MYEHHTHPILHPTKFAWRVFLHALCASCLMLTSLGLGVLGYHHFAQLSWIDSLLNASMILGGMGPVSPLETNQSKLFASFYALFSGIIFIGVAGIMLAPLAHRLLHYLHLDEDEEMEFQKYDQLTSKN